MKIVCDSCSTKYSISDDKVRGKVFKIRCKKCSHIIVVRGNADAAPAAVEAAPAAVWHVVVDGDQVGPLTEADVRARANRGEITPDNYVWKEGFADWLKLSDVPDFADLNGVSGAARIGGEDSFPEGADATAEPSERVAYAGEPVVPFAGSEPHAAASPASSDRVQPSGRVRAPAAAAASAENDAFSAPAAPAASPGADLFGMAPVAAHADSGRVRGRGGANGSNGGARHDGGRVENLTAQRSENSVLFSISSLQSLASPSSSSSASAPSGSSTTDGSGLIDIRAMAASTLRPPSSSVGAPLPFGSSARSAEDDLPTFGAFSSASPVLMALPQSSGPPKWVYALFALAALLFIGVGVVAVSILRKPVMVEPVPTPTPVAAVPAAPAAQGAKSEGKQEGKQDGRTGKSADGAKIAESDLPPRDGAGSSGEKPEKSASERGSSKGKKPKSGKKGGDEKSSSGSGSSASSGAGPAVAVAEPEKPKAQKGSLDELLEGALNGRPSKKSKGGDDDSGSSGSKKGGGDSAGGGTLAKSAVVAGMNSVKGKISACYAQYHVPGLAMVNVVIGKSGKVTSATVTGKFAGTPSGTCVEAAVKSASFPPSDGLSTPYPFNLR